VFSVNSEQGGNDNLSGGDDHDVLIGGAADDALNGGAGDDFVSGDGGKTTYRNGRIVSVETTEFFIGGQDDLDGGADNDLLFGGFENDLFRGNLSEDALIGEYARAIINGGEDGFENGVFMVRLGQEDLDLLASTQFSLYNKFTPGIGYSSIGGIAPVRGMMRLGGDSVDLFGNPLSALGSHSGDSSQSIIDLINQLPGTQAGNPTDTPEEEESEQSCFNDEGFVIDCEPPVEGEMPLLEAELPLLEGESPELIMDAPVQSPPLEIEASDAEMPAVETPAVEATIKETIEATTEGAVEPDAESAENSIDGEMTLLLGGLAGWKLASGRSSDDRFNQKPLEKNALKQKTLKANAMKQKTRGALRWDEEKQCFVALDELTKTAEIDWEMALNRRKLH